MTIEEAERGYPVRIRAVVTYYNWDAGDLFIQDSTAGIWVNPGETKLALHQGEFVEVEGFSAVGDFAPDIDHAHFRSLGEAPMPKPQRPTSDELASGRQDSQWIELEGVVRSVAEREGGLVLNVSSGAFECSVFVLKYPSLPTDIVDGRIRIRGVFSGLYDSSNTRFIGFQALTPSWSDVKVLERPTQQLWSVPARPMRTFLRLTPEGAFTHRVHVRGVVTFQQVGRFLCVRDSGGALLVNTTQPTPLKVGDLIDAMGFPAIGDYTGIMRDAIFQRVSAGPAPEPVAVSPEKLRVGSYNADLVRLSARLLNCTTRPGEEVLDLQAGGVTFRAVLNTGTNSSPLGSLRAGSLLQLTGVMIVEADKNHEPKGFEILLRSPADVVVLELPSWWTPGRLLLVLSLLGVAVISALGWIAALRRRVRQQTETLRLKYERELALEEQYRDLFENANDLIQWVDPQGRLVHVNPAWRKTLGYSEEEAANLSLFDIIHPNCREHCVQLFERLMSGKKIEQVEVEFVARNGQMVVLEGSCDCQFVDGKPASTRGIFRDVTERRRMEEALIEERHLLYTLMDNLPDAIYFKDHEGRFTRTNKANAKKFGLSDPSEAVGKTDFDFFSDEHARQACADEQEIIRTGQPVLATEEKETWPDGRATWVSTTKMPLRDAQGRIIGTFGVSRDITERKQAEQARRFLACIVESSDYAIFGTAPDGTIISWNAAAEALFGYAASEILGKHVSTLVPPARLGEVPQILDGLRRGESFFHFETTPMRKDGTRVTVSLTISPIKSTAGEVIGAATLAHDISERKQAEEALKESEERFRGLFENATIGIYRTTPEGRILMANPALVRMLGYGNFEELATRNLEDQGYEPSYPRKLFRERMEREGEIRGLDATWTKRDGSVIFLRERGRAIRGEHGEVLYYDGLVEDVTERRQLEEQLRQAQKMEAVGRLAAGLAHDFNNLLTVVIGYSDLLMQRLSADDRLRPAMEEIKKAGEQAASLTRQLLAFSRKQALQPQVLDLSSLLSNVDKMLQRVIGEDIELVTHLPPGLGHVKADPGQIEQVIMNLALNARDAMPQGGQLTLEAANVELDSSYASSHESVVPGHFVMLAMSDTGTGMDAETQAHIFEPFFTTKEKGKGTGLGLSTVYGIIKQSGGNIWVYSEPARGTTFKIYLPRVDQAVELITPGELGVEELSQGSETILLVEDEEAVRSLAREVLECRGYHVLEAKGAIEALQVGEQHKERIHLLLTDVVMPQMSGRELAEHLAPLRPETKVLYMSGYADNAVVHHGLLDPGTALLQKPFTADALARKLREVLDSAGDQKTRLPLQMEISTPRLLTEE
jgi:PAS domain S-box-containing protein